MIRLKRIITGIVNLLRINYCESYELKDKEELYEYMRLGKEKTGLDVDILIDDCASYKKLNHPLLLFICINDNEYIPISIEKEPKVLTNIEISTIQNTIDGVKRFISTNHKLIKRILC